MAGALRQYDPLQVVGSWNTDTGSVDFLDGRIGDGIFVSVTVANQRWTMETDAHGNATRVKNNNRSGVISIALAADSPTNLALSARVAADDVAENVVGAIVLQDLNGTTLVEAEGCFLDGLPATIDYGPARGQRAWTFQCAAIRAVLGGFSLA